MHCTARALSAFAAKGNSRETGGNEPGVPGISRLLQDRLRLLRQMLAQEDDPEEIWHIQRRIAELTPMLTQMNELAELTEHYYERGYWRSEKYTL